MKMIIIINAGDGGEEWSAKDTVYIPSYGPMSHSIYDDNTSNNGDEDDDGAGDGEGDDDGNGSKEISPYWSVTFHPNISNESEAYQHHHHHHLPYKHHQIQITIKRYLLSRHQQ